MAFNLFQAIGGGIGSGFLGDLFGSDYKNPAGAASPFLNKIPDAMKQYLNPYIQQGQQSGNQLQNQYSQLMSDPGSIISRLGAGYKQSPGYQWRLGQGEQAINNAQAAGGMAGTGQHQQLAGQLAENMAGEDYNNYLSSVLGLYGQGLGGLQGFQTQGYGASTGLAEALAQALSAQGQYAYAGQAGENQANSQNKSNLFGALGTIGSFFL